MVKNFLSLILLLTYITGVNAQVSLEDIIQKTVANYPKTSTSEKLAKLNGLELDNLSKNFLPQVNLNAQATYQSDVTSVPIDNPMFNIPTVPKDQYRAYLEINQVIYDGKATAGLKALQNAKLEADQLQISHEVEKVKDLVIEVFFGIASVNTSIETIKSAIVEIEENEKVIKVGIANGVLLESDLFLLQAEKIAFEQKLNALTQTKQKLQNGLSVFTLDIYNNEDEFVLPKVNNQFNNNFENRKDIKMLVAQQSVLTQQIDILSTNRQPKVYAFANAGVGRPGLNMLDDSFSPYYIVGVRATWNLWDWNKTKNKQQAVQLQKEMVDDTKKTLEQQLSFQSITIENEIVNLERLLIKDQNLVELRRKIKTSYEQQLENGVIRSTDYLHHLNKEKLAMLQKEKREIELIKTKYQYQRLLQL